MPAAAVLGLTILVGQLVALVRPELRTPVFGLSLLLLDAVGAVYSVRAFRHTRSCRGWPLIAAARALSVVSTVAFGADAYGYRPGWWIGTVSGLGMFAGLSAGVLTIPGPKLRGRQRWAFRSEMATLLIAGCMLIGYFVFDPLYDHPPGVFWLEGLGFPIGNLALVASVSAILLRGTAARLNRPAVLLLCGILLYAFADGAHFSLQAHGLDSLRPFLAKFCLLLASFLMTAAATTQCALPPSGAVRPRLGPAQWSRHLPYAAVTTGNVLMLVVTVQLGAWRPWAGLVAGEILMTGLMYLRQMISLRDSRDLAVTDSLTGLANRAGFDAQLDRILRRGEQVAVVLVDLDGFKSVNDVHGHATGDSVLAEFARVVRGAVRRRDVAARVGGDEFVIVLSDITDPAHAVTVVNRILTAAAATPVRLDGEAVPIRASIGIATGGAGDGAKELLRRADVAMYTAKRSGTHGWQLYDASMVDRRARDAELAEHLRGALADDQFQVLYQPLVELADGRIAGVEALLRWHHPKLGSVPPVEFIPIAERSEVINAIGLWVLEQACRQVRAWHQLSPDLRASVNVSPRQLQRPGLVEDVRAALARTGLPAERLILEVTESAMVDQKIAVPTLRALRVLGVRIAIDDFGTGYSSLHYLTRLPVDALKIDRSFVSELNGTPEGAAVTEAIVRLSQVLQLTTVAEGIETAGQAAELSELGCQFGQGYLYARPVPAAELEGMLSVGLTASAG